MRTDNPLLSPGFYRHSTEAKPPTGSPSINPHSKGVIPARAHSTLSTKPKSRPSHKRHSHIHLSQSTIHSVEYALQHGWAAPTLSNYGSAVDRFLAFCSAEGVPEEFQLPADEFVLCAFAASSAGIHAGSTARNNIAALKAWHTAQNAQWNGSSRLHYVLAGVEKLAPDSSKRPPRPPINATMLRALYDGLDFSDPRDVAVFAAACVAFWGQCRLGEILPTSSYPSATQNLPTRRHISRSSRKKRSTILRLPRTKTKVNGEDVVLVSQTSPINPRVALDMHLTVNKCNTQATLFAYTSTNGVATVLTKAKFLQRCNEIWQRAGYPRTTGHSFRIGGTTELLLAGISPDIVKAMGRWSSDAFHRYWRSLEDLAPLHAEFIPTG
ncbi:DNA breaking-rejoining enzyme [Mycena crocata]|nr:DNA breaking-rejoining enzyme [Mycena crocata]